MEELQTALHSPGNLCVFIDDSGMPGPSTTKLAADFKIYLAVTLSSKSYPDIERKLKKIISKAKKITRKNIQELHAKEIVNPTGESLWKNVPIRVRLKILKKWYKIIFRHVKNIFTMWIGSEQYRVLMAKVPKERLWPSHIKWRCHEDGLETIFHKALVEGIRMTDKKPIVIVEDSTKKRDFDRDIKFKPEIMVYKNCVHYLPSHSILGLQLADLCAYHRNRMFIIFNRISKKQNPFDRLMLTNNKWLSKRIIELLKLKSLVKDGEV